MGTRYKVIGTGHGLNFINYPSEVEIYLPDMEDCDEEYKDEKLNSLAKRELKRKTSCNSVTIQEIKKIE